MTVNEDSKLISEMVALLAKSGISAQDCELAEMYLNGQAGDEVLDQFERKDLMTISRQLVDEAKKITEHMRRPFPRSVKSARREPMMRSLATDLRVYTTA